MPKIPTIERKAKTRQIQGVTLQAGVPTPTEPQAPKIAEKLANRIYEEETKRINEIAVLDADLQSSKIETELLHNPENGALNKFGKMAAGAYDPTMEAFDKRTMEIMNSLVGNVQKSEYAKYRNARRANIDLQLQRHVSTETKKHDLTTSKNWLANQQANLENIYYDGKAVRDNIRLQIQEIINFARRNPEYDAEWLEKARRDAISDSHKKIIEHMMADGNDLAAKDYYKENSKGIYDDAKLKEDIDVASSDGLAKRTVMDVVEEHGPKDDDDPFNIDIMMAELRKILKDDEKALKLAKALLKERKTVRDASVKERADANESILWEAEDDGASIEELLAMPEYRAMPGQYKRAFKIAVMRISSEEKLERMINQEKNFSMLSEDIALLRDTDIDKMLDRKELNPRGHRGLKKLLDPKNQPGAKDAYTILRNARTNDQFDDKDEAKNTRIWAEYNGMLHQYLIDYPDGDPVEFVNKLMKPIEVTVVTDIIRGVWKTFGIVGGPRALKPGETLFNITTEEEAREKKLERIRREAGPPRRRRKRVTLQEGATITNKTTGEKMVLKEGKWQTLGK